MQTLKDSNGSTVVLTDSSTVIKTAHDHEQYAKLRNAVRFHRLLGPLGIAPQLLADNDSNIELEYIQDSTDKSNQAHFEDNLRRNAIKLLLNLKKYNVYHTDLTEYNYIPQEYRLCPIDWSEARFGWENAPNKRQGMDADWLYPSLLHHITDHNRIVRKWIAVREHIKHLRGYGRVLDLGCLYGDISAMASTEGFDVIAIDNGAFDTEWDKVAFSYFKHGPSFIKCDMFEWDDYKYDVVCCLSSWSHFVKQNSYDVGVSLLDNILQECGVLFFENHLKGDGPGVIESERDHIELFKKLGATATPITTISVGGRPFSRTVYKVIKYA